MGKYMSNFFVACWCSATKSLGFPWQSRAQLNSDRRTVAFFVWGCSTLILWFSQISESCFMLMKTAFHYPINSNCGSRGSLVNFPLVASEFYTSCSVFFGIALAGQSSPTHCLLFLKGIFALLPMLHVFPFFTTAPGTTAGLRLQGRVTESSDFVL